MLPSEEELYKALEARHGKERQKKFSRSSVAVCGLGGLGSNIAIALARAGIGRLHLIDFDKVDLSNVGRQQYFLKQIGMYKTDAITQILHEINPCCNIDTQNIKLCSENIPEILSDDDVICEAFDNPESKSDLIDAVSEAFPEKYIVASSGMAGLHTANSIQTRKITSRFYLCGDGESDAFVDGTLYASRVMVCAAHQANAVLRIIDSF